MSDKKNNKNGLDYFFARVIAVITVAAVTLVFICAVLSFVINNSREETVPVIKGSVEQPEIKEMLLTVNKYSRPGKVLKKVNGVVIHYTANPGSSAEANRNYFEGLRKKGSRYASSHFVVGLEGEIIQCIPLNEIAYASNQRNEDTISVEVCHKDKSGKYSDKTYKSLVSLVAWLCSEYGLGKDDIIRHYDVTGKLCPKYYVEHPKAWAKLKNDIIAYGKKQEKQKE